MLRTDLDETLINNQRFWIALIIADRSVKDLYLYE